MKIADKIDAVMTWITEGSASTISLKILGISSVIAGAIVGPFLYLSHQNSRDYTNLLSDLDKAAKVLTFKSVPACVAKGFTEKQCEASKASALSWIAKEGTSLDYSSLDSCVQVHGPQNCPEKQTPLVAVTLVGNNLQPMTTINIATSFVPPVIAWQAAAHDLTLAAPLYPTAEGGMAVRHDGAKVGLGESPLP